MTNEEANSLNASVPLPPAGHTFTFKRTLSFGRPPDQAAAIGRAKTRSFERGFRGERPPCANNEPGRPRETDYQVLSGRPDPNREFFIIARRALGWLVTLTAVAIPLVLVLAGVLGGADPQTIVLLGIFGAIVALMLKSTFSKTPFG